jgi:SAM-dependent methyltransferase
VPGEPLDPRYFRREDESPDELFYAEPRLVVHIDEPAIAAATEAYRQLLPAGGAILDLMSSWRSHLPPEVTYSRVAGLGMNAVELRENPRLTEWVVQDINADPRLPYADGEFDGVVMTVSVQYLTRPVETFREVQRVLVPGAPFVVTFSNRCFPTKAIAAWRATTDREHAGIVATYFQESGGWGTVLARDCSPRGPFRSDPLFAVWAVKAG